MFCTRPTFRSECYHEDSSQQRSTRKRSLQQRIQIKVITAYKGKRRMSLEDKETGLLRRNTVLFARRRSWSCYLPTLQGIIFTGSHRVGPRPVRGIATYPFSALSRYPLCPGFYFTTHFSVSLVSDCEAYRRCAVQVALNQMHHPL